MIWHSHNVNEVLRELNTDAQTGLSQDEANRRLAEYGENRVNMPPPYSYVKSFLHTLRNPFILLLIVFSLVYFAYQTVNGYVQGALSFCWEGILIPVIVLLFCLRISLLHARNYKERERIAREYAPKTTVLRDGVFQTVSVLSLVPGDIISVTQGDIIPADCRLVQGQQIQCDENPLNGSHEPKQKLVEDCLEDRTPFCRRTTVLFSGCAVLRGTGLAVVVATGRQSEIAHITDSETHVDDDNHIIDTVEKFERIVVPFIILASIVLFALRVITLPGLLYSLLSVIVIAVSLMPKHIVGFLSYAGHAQMKRFSEKNWIVRSHESFQSIENDTVIAYIDAQKEKPTPAVKRIFVGKSELSPTSVKNDSVIRLLSLAMLGVKEEAGVTREALFGLAGEMNIQPDELFDEAPVLESQAQTETRPYSLHVIEGENGFNLLVALGQPSAILSACVKGHIDIALEVLNQWQNYDETVAVAYRIINSGDPSPIIESSGDLTLAGLFAIGKETHCVTEPASPRTEKFARAFFSDEEPAVALAHANAVGIYPHSDRVYTAVDYRTAEFGEDNVLVFAGLNANEQQQLVEQWHENDRKVAVVGTTDAIPSLYAVADVRITHQVDKDSFLQAKADVLLPDTSPKTVAEFVSETVAQNSGALYRLPLMFFAPIAELIAEILILIFFSSSALPILPLLWFNFVCKSVFMPELLASPWKTNLDSHASMTVDVLLYSGLFGGITFLVFYLGNTLFQSTAIAETLCFGFTAFSLSLFSITRVDAENPFAFNGLLYSRLFKAFLVCIALCLVIMLVPGIQGIFSLVSLPWKAWLILVGLSLVPALFGETLEWIVNTIKYKR